MEELAIMGATPALAVPSGTDYRLSLFGRETVLRRDVDFGVIPRTKQPSLYKAGAEAICMAYGLMQRYSIESSIENPDPAAPLFYFLVKCELVKLGKDGKEYVFCSSFGSANTSEKRNGFNGAFDAANSTLKMAQKRALTSAALSVSGLSSMFTQDMENESFMAKSADLLSADTPESPISTAQIRRLYAIGGEAGMTPTQVKARLALMGISSTRSITQEKYNEVCDFIVKKGE